MMHGQIHIRSIVEFRSQVFSLNVMVIRLTELQNRNEKINLVEQSVDKRLCNIKSGWGELLSILFVIPTMHVLTINILSNKCIS